MIRFPYYSGDIRSSKARGLIELEDFIDLHKKPTSKTLKIIEDINKARVMGLKEVKNDLKQQLTTFTPGVFIRKGERRRYDNIVKFTGLMQIDLDKIPTYQETLDLKEHIFHSHEEIICIYFSPSGYGLKALMKINQPKNIEQYRLIHNSVANAFEQYEYFDLATKNAILPLFLSVDTEIMYRSFDKALEWKDELEVVIKYEELNDIPKIVKKEGFNYNKVLRITTDRINGIIDNGHPQVRSTALVLGSRVGAGYISEFEATSLIENLIKNNNYLKKGIKGYVSTAIWGIKNGATNPKYYN